MTKSRSATHIYITYRHTIKEVKTETGSCGMEIKSMEYIKFNGIKLMKANESEGETKATG